MKILLLMLVVVSCATTPPEVKQKLHQGHFPGYWVNRDSYPGKVSYVSITCNGDLSYEIHDSSALLLRHSQDQGAIKDLKGNQIILKSWTGLTWEDPFIAPVQDEVGCWSFSYRGVSFSAEMPSDCAAPKKSIAQRIEDGYRQQAKSTRGRYCADSAFAATDCTVAEARAAYKPSAKLVGYRRVRESSEYLLTETFTHQGIPVKVVQGGCAHLGRSIEFTLPLEEGRTIETKYWFERLQRLLSNLPTVALTNDLQVALKEQHLALLATLAQKELRTHRWRVEDKGSMRTLEMSVELTAESTQLKIGVLQGL